MYNKLKEIEYLILVKYYFIGVILATIVYQFVGSSLLTKTFQFNIIFNKATAGLIFGSIGGAIVGGYFFYKEVISHSDRVTKELKLWSNIKEKNTWFFIVNITAFAFGGFIGKMAGIIFDMDNYSNFFQQLLTLSAISEYIAMMLAGAVFGLFLSIGIKKRLKSLYGNE